MFEAGEGMKGLRVEEGTFSATRSPVKSEREKTFIPSCHKYLERSMPFCTCLVQAVSHSCAC